MAKIIELPNRIFPFRLSDLESSHHNGYRIECVYQQLSESQRQDAIDFWVANRILSSEIAERRCTELCYLVRDQSSDSVVGVSTLYPDRLGDPPQSALMMRMFILSAHRNIILSRYVWKKTIVFARYKLNQLGYLGVVNVNENRRLARKGTRREFEKAGYRLLGEWQGQDVWLLEFSKVAFRDTS